MYKSSYLLSFYAETPVHMGSGTSVSYVDLPVQRERHTSFPVLWSSGIKGVLRNFALRKWNNNKEKLDINGKEKLDIIFGPGESGEDYSSCISVTDAKILLYPVRSVRGVFAWITCPLVLKRFKEDLNSIKSINNNQNTLDFNILDLNILDESLIIISENSNLKIENQAKVAFEEFVFRAHEKDLNNLLSFLKELFPENSPFKDDIINHLAIVSDNVFKDFVNYAVEIRTRIRIDQDKGTAKEGALFTQELIPSETIFYSLVFISDPKKSESNISVNKEIEELFKGDPILQLGGDETTGKGFFRVKLYK